MTKALDLDGNLVDEIKECEGGLVVPEHIAQKLEALIGNNLKTIKFNKELDHYEVKVLTVLLGTIQEIECDLTFSD